MRTSRKPAPPQDRPSGKDITTAKDTADAADFAFDRHIVDRVDESIWRAIYNGEFRLGVPCERCGRWLYQGRSKKRGMGEHCAAKAAAEAVAE